MSFKHILEKDPALYAETLTTLKSFQPWIRNSGMPFFPAYTDHSERHISEVLATASSIITDDARALLTPGDITVLVLSTLLHDVALHTTQDGFRALVCGKYQPQLYRHFGDRDWPSLWSEFLAEASRFDGRQLVRIFGDARPIDPRSLDIDDLSERENLLVGEFIRRHHARLAHQIATAGVPGPGSERIRLSTEFDEHMRELAGLVARSHNFSIRDSFEFLDSYDRKEFKGIRPVFLMAVLRIADYFQVHAERAERDLLKVKQIRSPVSKQEWTKHDAVRDVRATHDDPEAIFIDALPRDVQTFAQLRWLISDIQRELDQSWAVLGEVYGRFPPLNRLGLTIRRVRSTLDDIQGLALKVDYIPTHAAFEASGPDLLRLLVGPLYSDDPTIGVRELMQNAIDACRELDDLKQEAKRQAENPQVEITIDQGVGKHGALTVRDRGVGMTLDIVQNYFLRAGASFRHSDAWRRQHEDEEGRSRVLRGGRFGVGALAAFLIGDKIEVVTRHIDAAPENGIAFSAELDATEIELRRTTAPAGTTITIHIRDGETWERLVSKYAFGSSEENSHWYLRRLNWFGAKAPSVSTLVRNANGDEIVVNPRFVVPEPRVTLPPEWHRIESSDFYDVQWTYARKTPALVCNGIFVTEEFGGAEPSPYVLWGHMYRSPIMIRRPNLSIYDNQGNLPLNLQRNNLAAQKLSFDDALVESVAKDVVASIVVRLPSELPSTQNDAIRASVRHPALIGGRFVDCHVIFTTRGVVWFEPPIVASAGIRRLWVVPTVQALVIVREFLPEDVGVLVVGANPTPADKFRLLTCPMAYGGTPISFFETANEVAMLTKREFKMATRPKAVRKDLIAAVDRKPIRESLLLFNPNTTERKLVDEFYNVAEAVLAAGGDWIAQWDLAEATRRLALEVSPIGLVWRNIARDGLIPFDYAEREPLKAAGRAIIGRHLECHEAIRSSGDRTEVGKGEPAN